MVTTYDYSISGSHSYTHGRIQTGSVEQINCDIEDEIVISVVFT